jgi:hypothetical protein
MAMLETEKARTWNADLVHHKHPHGEKLAPVFRLKNASHVKGVREPNVRATFQREQRRNFYFANFHQAQREHQSSMVPTAAERNAESIDSVADDKLAPMERRFAFIMQQHSDMLTALHNEISELKEKNKGIDHR